jgi:hypothetical protein
MLELEKPALDAEAFLASAGLGRRIVKLRGKQTLFSQGEAADSLPDERRAFADGLGVKLRTSEERLPYPNDALV